MEVYGLSCYYFVGVKKSPLKGVSPFCQDLIIHVNFKYQGVYSTVQYSTESALMWS